jgi:hypothetical protein
MIDQKFCKIKNPVCDMLNDDKCAVCEMNTTNQNYIINDTNEESQVSIDYEGMKNSHDPLYRLLYEYGERIKELEETVERQRKLVHRLDEDVQALINHTNI